VSCPTTFTNDWTYNSTTQPGAVVGGIVTGCTAAGDVLTLSATGGFNAATGTRSRRQRPRTRCTPPSTRLCLRQGRHSQVRTSANQGITPSRKV
jgi:hypothetical protein